MEHLQPDPNLFYEHPQNRQELESNLNYVIDIMWNINVPIYLNTPDYIEQYEPKYQMMQLYYMFTLFKHQKVDRQSPIKLTFRDAGRSVDLMMFSDQHRDQMIEEGDGDNNSADEMDIIEEEDSSLDFNSSLHSKPNAGNEIYPVSTPNNVRNQISANNISPIPLALTDPK